MITCFSYDFDISAAQIIQIGVVTEIDVETEKFLLDMTSTDLLITPGPNGKRHWQKPYFSLVPKRAYAYEIPKRFAESFNKQDWSDIKVVQPSRINTGSMRLPSLHEEEGYVYIWQMGFKIVHIFRYRMERVGLMDNISRFYSEFHGSTSTQSFPRKAFIWRGWN